MGVKADGTIVTWGMPGESADAVEHLARGGSADKMMRGGAVVLPNGNVRMWGKAAEDAGAGDVASRLAKGVRSFHRTQAAFTALRDGGDVVAWGHPSCGGDASAVAAE